jgi:hypothetical protein
MTLQEGAVCRIVVVDVAPVGLVNVPDAPALE